MVNWLVEAAASEAERHERRVALEHLSQQLGGGGGGGLLEGLRGLRGVNPICVYIGIYIDIDIDR